MKMFLNKYWQDILSIVYLTAIVAIYFFPLFYPEPQFIVTPDFGLSDAWHFSIPTKFELWRNLHNNTLPFWTPNMGNGFPLIAEGQVGAFYLPNLILYKFFTFPYAYNLSLVLTVLTAGIGMYAWCRQLKHSPVGSLLAGSALMFSGIIIPQLPHITLLQGFSLLPLIAFFTKRLSIYKTLGIKIVLIILFSQQLFSGFPQAFLITVMYVFPYYLWINKQTIRTLLKAFGNFIFVVIGALLLSAIQILPSYEFLQNSTNPKGFKLPEASQFSFPLRSLVTLVKPYVFGNPSLGTFDHFSKNDGTIFWETNIYIGVFTTIVFIFGIYMICKIMVSTSKKRQLFTEKNLDILYLVVVIPISILLMWGKHSPLYFIYSLWPFNFFRVPARFTWIFIPSILVIASHALDLIVSKRIFVRRILLIVVIVQSGYSASMWQTYHTFGTAKQWLNPPKILQKLDTTSRLFTYGFESKYIDMYNRFGWKNTQLNEFFRNAFYPNSALLWSMAHTRYYAGRFLRRPAIISTLEESGFVEENDQIRLKNESISALTLSGVTHVLSMKPLVHPSLHLIDKISFDIYNIHTYQIINSLPELYAVSKSSYVQSIPDALKELQNLPLPIESALVEQNDLVLSSADKSLATVEILTQTDTTLTAIVNNHSQDDKILVRNQTYYPGWTATIDERVTKIFPVNVAFQGIRIPPGSHTILIIYKPRFFLYGVIFSIGTLLFMIMLFYKKRLKIRHA